MCCRRLKGTRLFLFVMGVGKSEEGFFLFFIGLVGQNDEAIFFSVWSHTEPLHKRNSIITFCRETENCLFVDDERAIKRVNSHVCCPISSSVVRRDSKGRWWSRIVSLFRVERNLFRDEMPSKRSRSGPWVPLQMPTTIRLLFVSRISQQPKLVDTCGFHR